jgi:predicted dehydrogenase
MPLARTLRYGMVGGGPGAFIGAVHRRAAAMDGLAQLVAGAFAARPEASHAMGRELHLDPGRVYGTFAEMAEREAARAPHDRLDFVSIVTPNFLHFAAARAFVERGFHVVCEKPMTVTLEDAEALCRLVAERGTVFALTHTYAGYPMVKQARASCGRARSARCARCWSSTRRGGSLPRSRLPARSRRGGAPTPRRRAPARSATSARTPSTSRATSPASPSRRSAPT